MKEKPKTSKIILILSFLPYLLPFAVGIYEAVFKSGPPVGVGGPRPPMLMFFYGLLASGVVFSTVFPILPACLTYQIFYLVRARSRSAMNISQKKYWGICAAICGVMLLISTVLTITALITAADFRD